MTSRRKPYNTYTKEFKLEALRMMGIWGQYRMALS